MPQVKSVCEKCTRKEDHLRRVVVDWFVVGVMRKAVRAGVRGACGRAKWGLGLRGRGEGFLMEVLEKVVGMKGFPCLVI